ncbi:hypothetical protein GCM10029992_21090 [Glycomyces albus]
MNTEFRGDDADGPGDESIRSAFDSYRAEASANFPPGSVDDLLMSGPAKLRRRRLVSLAAVVGACTAVTAGGFAVAQTLGSIPKQTAQEDPPAASQGTVEAEDDDRPELGDPFSPEVSEETDEGTDDPDDQPETTIVLADWGEDCAGGEYVLDFSTWEFAEDTAWAVRQSVVADVVGGEARRRCSPSPAANGRPWPSSPPTATPWSTWAGCGSSQTSHRSCPRSRASTAR